MRKTVPIFFWALFTAGKAPGQAFKTNISSAGGIGVQFHKNIEFLGFVFFLGSQYMGEQYENDETLTSSGYKKKDWYAYDLSLYQQYKSFKGNNNLEIATKFAENLDGGSLISFLIQLDEVPHARIPDGLAARYYITFSEKKDSAEARQNTTRFIEALNQFYKETNFDSYFTRNDHLYEQALKEIKNKLPKPEFVPAMEKFYRQSFGQYTLLPSLTIPSGMAFAANYERAGKIRIYNCFGPYGLQQFSDTARLNMGFADEKHLRELSTHEFGHSFVNPVLDKLANELIDQTASLFDTVRSAMDNQGYNVWRSCVYEHFVRAGEVIIAKSLGNRKDAEKLQSHYINDRKFIYLPLIIDELERYNKNASVSYLQAARRVMEKLKLLAPKVK